MWRSEAIIDSDGELLTEGHVAAQGVTQSLRRLTAESNLWMPRTWNNLPGRKLRTNKGSTDLGQVCQHTRGLNGTITSWRQWICNKTSGILWPITHSFRDTVKSGMQQDPTQSRAHSGCWVTVRCCVNPKDASVNTGRGRGGGRRGGRKQQTEDTAAQGEAGMRSAAPGWVMQGAPGALGLPSGPEMGGSCGSLQGLRMAGNPKAFQRIKWAKPTQRSVSKKVLRARGLRDMEGQGTRFLELSEGEGSGLDKHQE